MDSKKLGAQTAAFSIPPVVVGHGNVVGKKEGDGPLSARFDFVSQDDYFGEKTWEKVECAMQEQALQNALKNAGRQGSDLDFLLAGDLLNQCISSSFAADPRRCPFWACTAPAPPWARACFWPPCSSTPDTAGLRRR